MVRINLDPTATIRDPWHSHIPNIAHANTPPPAVESSATAHVQTGPEFGKNRGWEALGEDVCIL